MPTPSAPGPDNADLTSLLEAVRYRVARLFRSFKVPPSDAEDLLQDALVALVASWSSVLEPEAWLLAILRYRCYAYLRRERYEKRELPVDPEILESLFPDGADRYTRLDQELDVAKLARTLPESQRQLLRLRYVLGMSYEEAARSVGCRRDSVHRRLLGSIRHLKAAGKLRSKVR